MPWILMVTKYQELYIHVNSFFLYELLSNPKMHLSDMFSNVSTLIVDCVILLPQHSVTTAAQPELMSATFALVAFEFTSQGQPRQLDLR